MRVGILGGTFNPIHMGHLIIAEEARCQLALDHVLFIPAGQPWLRADETLCPGADRLRMVELANAGNPGFRVCSMEIDRYGPTYTVDTLEELLRNLGSDVDVFFIIGSDALEQFHRWKQPERILELCSLVVIDRPGFERCAGPFWASRFPAMQDRLVRITTPQIDISGTDIRQRVARGESIRYLVPEPVAEYIRARGLYLAGSPGYLIDQADATPRSSEGVKVDGSVDRLLELALEKGALTYGEYKLTSGKKSSYYFDGRLLSLEPEGAHLIAQALLPLLHQAGVTAVGGPTLGADPIVAAVALASHLEGDPIPAFIVRKETKTHGTVQLVEGPLAPGSRVAIIDDTCTTGGSLLHAIAAAEDSGCSVVKVLALLDRCEGGGEELRKRGYDFSALMVATPEGTIQVAGEA